MNYHIGKENVRRGPYTKSQLRTMWNSGLITSDTLYQAEGMETWRPLVEMFQERESAPLPPPPGTVPDILPPPLPKGKFRFLYSASIIIGLLMAG